jgi:hypothetical protein
MPYAEGYKGDAKAPLSSKAIGNAMACTAFSCAQMPRPLGRGFFTIEKIRKGMRLCREKDLN